MRQLILLIAVSLVYLYPIRSQTVMIDSLIWGTQTPGATSGTTAKGDFWVASATEDIDNDGFFGASPTGFRIENVEGFGPCQCPDGTNNCGANDNSVVFGPLPATTFCETSIIFDIRVEGDANCGAADDQQATDAVVGVCGEDIGAEWVGTDALEIRVLSSETGEERVTLICGEFSSTSSFTIDETFDVGADGTTIAVFITGGVQTDGVAYEIGNIRLSGIPRTNTALNTSIITPHDNNVVCEGEGTIIIQTAADPRSDFTWILPDGSSLSGSNDNGRDKLQLDNIDPSFTGTYTVRVVDENNCILQEEIDITVLPSSDQACLSRVRFSNLAAIQCSDVTLPDFDDNGVAGTWSPGAVLADFAGQTLNFTFTPDDLSVAPETFLLTIDDLSLFPLFGTVPNEIPIFCNASAATHDFIEIFQLNYTDYRLEVQGDVNLFDFIPAGSLGFVDDFVTEFRNIDVFGLTPRESVGFSITGYTDCGAEPIRKSFFISIVGPSDPIRVDTALCQGDFIEFNGFQIFRDTAIMGMDACDTMFVANITNLSPVTSIQFHPGRSASCGEVFYYYGTTDQNGMVIGWVKAGIDDPPPFGPDFDTLFTESFNGLYTLPIPASNGCDSIQRVALSIGQTRISTDRFELCENRDSIYTVQNSQYIVNAETPSFLIPTGGCDFLEVIADILPVEADTLEPQVHCAGEVVTIEVSPGRFEDFDDTMIYPFTVDLESGENGCPATVTVDLSFTPLPIGTLETRICQGESITIGSTTISEAVTDQEVIISGGASNGCDSIVLVTTSLVIPNSIPTEETLCPDEEFIIEGEIFDINRPTGSVPVLSSLGCDSIIYEVDLSFFEAEDILIEEVICPGESLELPEYRFTIDIDNLTADLVTSTADGCSQNVMIRATLAEPIRTSFEERICNGETYTFAGIAHELSGSYHDTIRLANGCDSISTLDLVVVPQIPATDDGEFVACTGQVLSHLGIEYPQAGRYRETLQSRDGCDSVVTFIISYLPIPVEDLGIQQVCPGEEFDFNGSTFGIGDHDVMLTTPDGCDSMVTFEVVFHEVPTVDVGVLTTCPAVAVDFNGESFSTEGRHTVTLTGDNGCDSIVAFTLEYLPIPREDIGQQLVCAGETWTFEGQEFGVGNHDVTLTSPDGCDSIVVFEVANFAVPSEDLGLFTTCPAVPFELLGETFETPGPKEITLVSSQGCDSIVTFTLELSDIPMVDDGVTFTCPGEPVDIFGQSYDAEGTFMATLQTTEGCDSIVQFEVAFYDIPTTDLGELMTCPEVPLIVAGQSFDQEGVQELTLTSSVGCDSIVTFIVVHDSRPATIVTETICPGESVEVFGVSYTTSTDEVITSPGAAFDNCDTSVHLQLTVLDIEDGFETYPLCEGSSIMVHGQQFDAAVEDFPIVIPSQQNCDSTIFVTIELRENFDVDLGTLFTCPGEDLTFDGEIITTEGLHTFTYSSAEGCDSIVTLNFERREAITTDISQIVCEGESFDFDGELVTVPGEYERMYVSTDGCDSVVTLTLDNYPAIPDTRLETEVICEGATFEFNGEVLSASGEYTFAFLGSTGCDSTVIVTLDVIEIPIVESFVEICDNSSFIFNNQTYTEEGVYDIVHTSQSTGCDSIERLNLTVNRTFLNDIGTFQMCPGGSVTVAGQTYTETGPQSVALLASTGCDSVVTFMIEEVGAIQVDLGVVTICDGDSYSFGDQEITTSGVYTTTDATAAGCDSITTIQVDVRQEMSLTTSQIIGSCEGGANGSFVIGGLPDAAPPFSAFGLPGVDVIESLPFTVTGVSEGTYSYELEDANGCISTGEAVVTNDREFAITINSVVIDPAGMYELTIEYSGEIVSIEWSDEVGLSCYDCPNPSVDIEEETTFTVTIVDAEGCTSMASITLDIETFANIYFPNVINPNSSQGNHIFFPQTEQGLIAQYDVYIFDRWGNMVYEMENGPVNDPSFGWNGRYRDNRINAGVYVYSVHVRQEDGTSKTFKGDITVLE